MIDLLKGVFMALGFWFAAALVATFVWAEWAQRQMGK